MSQLKYEDGKSCSHRGCLSHKSHPCETCGRILGRSIHETPEGLDWLNEQLAVEVMGYAKCECFSGFNTFKCWKEKMAPEKAVLCATKLFRDHEWTPATSYDTLLKVVWPKLNFDQRNGVESSWLHMSDTPFILDRKPHEIALAILQVKDSYLDPPTGEGN